MKIGITGATGFIGRYFVEQCLRSGHDCRCWHRSETAPVFVSPGGQAGDFGQRIEWVTGDLTNPESMKSLCEGCDALIHAALWRPGHGFRGAEGDLGEYVQVNVVGSLRLIESARAAGVSRFIFISTCAVHEQILDDRPLDEAHPLWATSHYGAHKGAIEKFVHSFGLGSEYPICALRPSGVYGIASPIEQSKWFSLIEAVVRGEEVNCEKGGKEVHAADVAKAASLLLEAEPARIAGQSFNCCDGYISQFTVARVAKEISGSTSVVHGVPGSPKHEIVTKKIRSLGMDFGGAPLLEATVGQIVAKIRGRGGG